jgi:hypothetical protein
MPMNVNVELVIIMPQYYLLEAWENFIRSYSPSQEPLRLVRLRRGYGLLTQSNKQFYAVGLRFCMTSLALLVFKGQFDHSQMGMV